MKDLLRRLGRRIREVRKARRVTQEGLAEQVEITPQYLSRIEGGRQSPSVEMLAKLADSLEVELWELFNFGPPGTLMDLRKTVRKLAQEADEARLRVALKVFQAVVR